MYRESLQKLGLSDKEALVYLTLLRLGPAVASTLARTTKIKRTSIYDVLNALLERNLIASYKQGNYTYFVVDDVNKLYLQEKQKTDLAKQLVSQFKDKKHMNHDMQAYYYKGHEGYREIYEEILRVRPNEIKVWIHLDNFYKGLDLKREEEWTKERIEKRIYARLIMQDTKMGRDFKVKDKKSHRETRFASKFPFDTTCFLYDDHILFFDSTHEINAMRIYHPELYQMFNQIFEMNWELLA